MFRKLLDEGRAGENVGVLLRGTKREEVERGQVLAIPGSVNPHTKFEAEYMYCRRTRVAVIRRSLRATVRSFTSDDGRRVRLDADGVEMVMPGDNINFVAELIAPIAMEEGLRFAIREGGRTVGAGVVAKILTEIKVTAMAAYR